jgi:threonine dehydrogenase-like Zn-dependent dehydrogenase
MQRKQIIFGYWNSPRGASLQDVNDTADMLVDGRMRIAPLITHRMPWRQTPEAYHMLYKDPASALGVIMEWD